MDQLLRSGYGDIYDRNTNGYMPFEKLQSLNKKTINLLQAYDPTLAFNGQYDYLFECKLDRFYVLID